MSPGNDLPQTRAEIAALIPHQGDMCLLERVHDYDADHIHCVSHTHLRADNPLLRQGRLAAISLCEYGAQATAVHGALLARRTGGDAAPGLLVALRSVQLATDYLDACPGLPADGQDALQISATRLHGDAAGCMYEFSVSCRQQRLVSGKVTIMSWKPE